MNYACPCCGFYTFCEGPGSYDVCAVCFWEDDPVQREDETFAGGANHVSLRQARKNFIAFGACEAGFKRFVRPPFDHEKSGI